MEIIFEEVRVNISTLYTVLTMDKMVARKIYTAGTLNMHVITVLPFC